MLHGLQDCIREKVFIPGVANQRDLRDALGAFPTGVAVVTIMGPQGPMGMTINSFSSVSLDPPLILWSPAKSSSRHGQFVAAGHFAIHVLGADQHHLCARFTRGGPGFDGFAWALNGEEVPLIGGTLARFECRRATTHDAGDHTLVVGEVLRAAHREGDPLCFARGSFGKVGELA